MSLEDMVDKGFLSHEQYKKELLSRERMKEYGKRLKELASGLDKETRWNILSGGY